MSTRMIYDLAVRTRVFMKLFTIESRKLIVLVLMMAFLCNSVYALETPKFTLDAYTWSNNMKKASVTTKERGLVFRINIRNDENVPVEITNLVLNIDLFQNEERVHLRRGQTTINNLYLPPNDKINVFFEVEFPYDHIGEYKAEVTYSIDNWVPEKIEPYPFRFKVVSEEIFAEEIKNVRPLLDFSGITINLTLIGGGVTIFGLGVLITYLWQKRS